MKYSPAVIDTDKFLTDVYETTTVNNIVLCMTEKGLAVEIPGHDPLPITDDALEDLCKFLDIPKRFTKSLLKRDRMDVLTYIQTKLAEAVHDSATYVTRSFDGVSTIVAFSVPESLLFTCESVKEADALFSEIAEAADFAFDLYDRETDGSVVSYTFLNKKSFKPDTDDSEWYWGYCFEYNVLGRSKAMLSVVLMRDSDRSLTRLPPKASKIYAPEVGNGDDFDAKFAAVMEALGTVSAPDWAVLEKWITRLYGADASLREVKGARSAILKTVIDKGDSDNEARLDKIWKWSEIEQKYGLRELPFKPSSTWYARASTPHNGFFVYNRVAAECAYAPRNVELAMRTKLAIVAGQMLIKSPDLKDVPPTVEWK